MEENSEDFFGINLALNAAISFNNLQNKWIGVDSDEISSFLNWKHQFYESFKDDVPNVKKKLLYQSTHR